MIRIKKHREIFNTKDQAKKLDALKQEFRPDQIRTPLLKHFKETYSHGFEVIKKRADKGETGTNLANAQSYLTDQIIVMLSDVVVNYIFHNANPSKAETLCVAAFGGYGRQEMAPYSDIDIQFILPYKKNAWCEKVVEYILYFLWDMGFDVGHAVRTIEEAIRLCEEDLTIKTALLEMRYIWGDESLFKSLLSKYDRKIIRGNAPEFTEQKLEERDNRHKKLGDTRYVVEPNLKEGKGGLRDLHTLHWIAKFIYKVHWMSEIKKKGVFSDEEYKEFSKAEDFLWAVRFQLHYMAGRPNERITFDVQKDLSEKLGYADRASMSGVERFMKHYFLTVKNVGDLTRIFCAYLEEKHKRRPLKFSNFSFRSKYADGFPLVGSRISVKNAKELEDDPVKMIEIFHVAQKYELDIHPRALRMIRQNLKFIRGRTRNDPRANELFIEIMTHEKGPGFALRLMNEVGVLGRFVPDFGRVVAQMQYDMYHVYTVDEHTIRAIELTSEVERGILAEEHPLANEIIHKVLSRKVLYVAVFLHDIAKGRKGDHSILGEQVAHKLCPRFGFTPEETETVAWLVRWHLLMTLSAFKRDLSDPKTISDFADQVQSPERLRLLLVLTVVDIRAVGPKVWNGWKGQLLRELYSRSEEYLLGGQIKYDNVHQVGHIIENLRKELPEWDDEKFDEYTNRFFSTYWLAVSTDHLVRNALMMDMSDKFNDKSTVNIHIDDFQNISELTIYAEDNPGLFSRLTGAIALSGASIQDARIFTTKDGMALDAFRIQDADGNVFKDKEKLKKLEKNINDTLSGELIPRDVFDKRRIRKKRTDVFKVAPRVLIDNKASNSRTVIELNGRDRIGYLFELSSVLVDLKISINSAHIATYGERAITVFFVRDIFGHKVTNEKKLEQIKEKLMNVLEAK
ncbi:[protein-PII] uridylyltransferase [Pseudemcibacter aquimaris]|uniref:[protein-PII] uridylyltransferase n=1 Tax=Pseudemcibacter aquimaris TaxID=2857064 RepID=UPI002010ECA3|nr:[protein-PII] uridylyltransferase [Pseudemcibacter aquimaris]MCC3862363.1 [protein-PII] uridylyltransferase [Pseudemcibacter aquimaris]WDU59206.1 [protein-PII] uridylyltransferase [Pseudemcibacter aquimaris]